MSGSTDRQEEVVHTLSGKELIEYVAERAARQAEQAVLAKSEHAARRVALIMSLFAFLGLGGVFGIVKYAAEAEARRSLEQAIPALTEKSVRPLLEREIGGIREELAQELMLSQYMAAVDSLNLETAKKDAFSDTIRDELMDRFRAVAAVPELLDRPQVRKYIRDTIEHFTRANQAIQLSEMDSLARAVILGDQQSALMMSLHYGEEVVGSPYSLDDLSVDLDRLDAYLAAAESMSFPEIALLWRILCESKRAHGQKTATLDRLVARVSDLNDQDRGLFHEHLDRYSQASNWQKEPTQAALELQRMIADLRSHYPILRQAGE